MQKRSAESVQRELSREILRGRYAPGSRLPGMRTLAEHFGVNMVTLQRAVAALEAQGLVLAKQGSGVVVRDMAVVPLPLIPDQLLAFADDLGAARAVFGELLELRRAVVVTLFSEHRVSVVQALDEALMSIDADADFSEADLYVARRMIEATGNRAALSLLDVLADVVRRVPAVARALYMKPGDNLHALGRLRELLSNEALEAGPLRVQVSELIVEQDKQSLRRFARIWRKHMTGGEA